MRPSNTPVPLARPFFYPFTCVLTLFTPCCVAEHKPPRVSAPAPAPAASLLADPAPLSDFEPERFRDLTAVPPAAVESVFDEQAHVACRWDASSWSGPLRVTAQTPAFATVYAGHAANIAIPEGDSAQGARVSFELLGLRLSVLVAARELDIHLAEPRLFDGYLWSGAGAPLTWTRASSGRVEYQLRLPARVTPVSGPPRGQLPCEGFSFDAVNDEEAWSRAVLNGKKSVLRGRWRGDERVPLSRAAGRPPLAFIDTRSECPGEEPEDCEEAQPNDVLVLDRRAHSFRIAYIVENVTVLGWVPETALQTSFETTDAPPHWGDPNEPVQPFGGNDPTRVEHGEKPLCAWNAPLAAEMSCLVRGVGTLASAIPVVPRAKRNGWREVMLEHPALSVDPAARLWVPERLLYPCEARH